MQGYLEVGIYKQFLIEFSIDKFINASNIFIRDNFDKNSSNTKDHLKILHFVNTTDDVSDVLHKESL